MEKKVKSEAIYNHWDNLVYIKTDGDMIYVICNKEKQMDNVNERFYGSGNELARVPVRKVQAGRLRQVAGSPARVSAWTPRSDYSGTAKP